MDSDFIYNLENEFSIKYQDLIRLNGFYNRPDAREIIYKLHKGICSYEQDVLPLESVDIGHIVPRSKPELFSKYFAGLDVDNLINLRLLSKKQNIKNSNYFAPSPLLIFDSVAYNLRLIKEKLNFEALDFAVKKQIKISDLSKKSFYLPHKNVCDSFKTPKWYEPRIGRKYKNKVISSIQEEDKLYPSTYLSYKTEINSSVLNRDAIQLNDFYLVPMGSIDLPLRDLSQKTKISEKELVQNIFKKNLFICV